MIQVDIVKGVSCDVTVRNLQANKEPSLPEQHKIEVIGGTGSGSVSHEDSKAAQLMLPDHMTLKLLGLL